MKKTERNISWWCFDE